MAVGLSETDANAIVAALDGTYMQLHTNDPGAAGTTAIATESDRQLISLDIPAGGAATNDGAIVWTDVAANEAYSHYSLWTAVTAGTFKFSGLITADAVLIGNTFTIAIGDLSVTVSTVAAA